MKILLDESLPRKLKYSFETVHEVFTVKDMDWLGIKNGQLLKLMVSNNFDYFVTVDRNLPYQQNTENLPLAIIVLCAYNNRLETLQLLVPKIFERIAAGTAHNVIEIYMDK
jgi:hypothetical protein